MNTLFFIFIGAFQENALSGEKGYKCRGYHPHLKNPLAFSDRGCNSTLRTRLRTSSSVYFPVIQSALSIPPWSRQAIKVIRQKYEDIKWISDENIRDYLIERILPTLSKEVTIDDLLHALQIVKKQLKSTVIRTEKDIYQDEYNELLKGDCNEGEFTSYTVNIPKKYNEYIDKIVVVDRLTEVQALYGFTRVKPWDSVSLKDEKIAPLSMHNKKWLPAVWAIG